MSFTYDDYLPSYEELDVKEINMSAAPLRAGAHQFGRYCDYQCKEFMLCNKEEKDPRKCINEGKEVTRCAEEFFLKLKAKCAEEFTSYWKCVDHSCYDMRLKDCRASQDVYDKCVLEHLGQQRPQLGHFSKVRVHQTMRPLPQREIPMPTPTPDPVDPSTVESPESVKYGSRFHFYHR